MYVRYESCSDSNACSCLNQNKKTINKIKTKISVQKKIKTKTKILFTTGEKLGKRT